MASSPPFQLEDQTDEDFFDKLVDDDFGPNEATSSSITTMKFSDGNDSDDARAFANLSIGEDSGGEDRSHEGTSGDDSQGASASGTLGVQADKDNDSSSAASKAASKAAEFDSGGAINLINEEPGLKVDDVPISDSAGEKNNDGSGSVGIKEVGWSSFYADSSENGGHGFGSYSDFFSEVGDNAGNFHGKMEENVNCGGETISGVSESKTIGSDNSVSYGQFHDGQVYGNSTDQTANGQDLNSSQNWENLYLGWKYDPNTGQWYQVDGQDASANAQGRYENLASDWSGVSDGKSDVAYLRQSTQSAQGTVVGTGTTESVSSWNQVSEVNNGYPEHMVFDPQYPGWYYDTIAQEWRSLESYNAAAQSTVQGHDQQIQNGYGSTGAYTNDNSGSMYGEYGQTHTHTSQDLGKQNLHESWNQSYSGYSQQDSNMWQSETAARTEAVVKPASFSSFGGNQQVESFYGAEAFGQQPSIVQPFENTSPGHFEANGIVSVRSFVPGTNLSQQFNAACAQQNGQMSFSNDFYDSQKSANVAQKSYQSSQQFSYAHSAGISPDGRPPHALVTFGFGGKLVVMKDNNSSFQNSSFGSQGTVGSSISVLNLMEVVTGNASAPSVGGDSSGYFRALCQQPLPGPLVGGNAGSRDLNKWLDERIVHLESPGMDFSKGKLLRLLFSLLKICIQHYGKLRSPFAADTTLKETDTPESAVAKLFASAKKNGTQNDVYGALSQCLQHLPPEAQMQATASEMQNFLVSGRKMEALQCAQEGQLWGPALVIAAQLGDQFYVETVKQMALRQLVAGSPLRTLCLLIAGQPAEVFSAGNTIDSALPGSMNMYQHQPQFGTNSMIDDWEENLAVIAANRTKDDELVITHLGDCLWKEKSEIIAAHICYLVAEKNIEPFSDTARLCLVGADHWKCPRTYASPDAIQRTELYEYSKVLGNSQYILLPFQPYKLIYAHMLAEVGKVSDSLKYCQAVLKSLKTGRAPEVETWKQLVLSLEERIRIHQQGGYTANLAPAKLVGKLLNFFDSTAHRVVGGLPPPAPSASPGNVQVNANLHQQAAPRVSTSQSTMTMSSLMPSASMEPISEWTGDGSRMVMHNRSVSEPDFGRRPRQNQVDSSEEKTGDGAQEKVSDTGTASRFGRFGFGSQLLKKTVGLVLRPKSSREAKLGDKNKFYYDEKLKRWVEEGAEPPAEEAALPPPPTTATFLNNSSDYGNKSVVENAMSPSGGSPKFTSPTPSENSSGIPPIPTSANQFSARGRMGARARYVDTFNQGRGNTANMFQSPSVPSVKPAMSANAKFFIPTPVTPSNDLVMEATAESAQEKSANENASVSTSSQAFQTPTSSSPMTMQRFPSMDNIKRTGSATSVNATLPPAHSRRTASWSGSFNGTFSPPEKSEVKPLGEALGMTPSTFMPSPLNSSSSFGDDLHEVEL